MKGKKKRRYVNTLVELKEAINKAHDRLVGDLNYHKRKTKPNQTKPNKTKENK